jgi:hypothetical protein
MNELAQAASVGTSLLAAVTPNIKPKGATPMRIGDIERAPSNHMLSVASVKVVPLSFTE